MTDENQSLADDRRGLSRRATLALPAAGVGIAAIGAVISQIPVADAATPPGDSLIPAQATKLRALADALARAPRRRDFKSVPMILTSAEQYDSEALHVLFTYAGGPKQVWDNTDLESPWLNLMRNSLNAQIWSFKNPDFLAVSATHGTCHLALYDQHIWDKYNLSAVLKHKFSRNIFLEIPAKVRHAEAADFNDPVGLFSPAANCIPLLMNRGVVFLGCHNAIWEFSAGLLAKGHNPDHLTHERLAADLTNHLIPGVVLTPGIVATLPLLTNAGFSYAK